MWQYAKSLWQRLMKSASTKKHAARPNRHAMKRRVPLHVEALEARELLAVSIQFDYRFDTAKWFDDPTNGEERKSILNLAGQLLASRIQNYAGGIPQPAVAWNHKNEQVLFDGNKENDDLYEWAKGSWTPFFMHPGNGTDNFTGGGQLDRFSVPEGVIIVFVGAFDLQDNPAADANTIGLGISGGFQQYGFDVSDYTDTEGIFHTGYRSNPVPWGGSIAFDIDSEYYYGVAPPPSNINKNDFLSLATHELGHVLGLDHFDEGTKAPSGAETAMDPTCTQGTRKLFTSSDWQALTNTGYSLRETAALVGARFYTDINGNGRYDNGEAFASLKEWGVGRIYNDPGLVDMTWVSVFVDTAAYAVRPESDVNKFYFYANVPGTEETTLGLTPRVGENFLSNRDIENAILLDIGFRFPNSILFPFLGLTEMGRLGQTAPTVASYTVTGQPGNVTDTIEVKRSSTNLVATVNQQAKSKSFSSVSNLSIDSGGGDDSVTLDFRYGNVIPPGGVHVNGGAGADSLTIKGGTFANVSFAVDGQSGTLLLDKKLIDFASISQFLPQFTATNLEVLSGRYLIGSSLKVTSQLTLATQGTLGGAGNLGAKLTAKNGSRVTPGDGTGTNIGKIQALSTLLESGSTLTIGIDGPFNFDQLAVTGTLKIDNASLSIDMGNFSPPVGQPYVIVTNDGTDAIQGTFAGLPEGATFVGDSHRFTISYRGGTGNDIVLTALSNAPTLSGGLTLSKPYITTGGTDIITITAVVGNSGRVDGVEFWLDANQNGRIDETYGVDILLRYHDALNLPSYYYTGAIGGLAVGNYKVFARARSYLPGDPNTYYSDPLVQTLNVVASPPEDSPILKVGTETRANSITTGNQYGGFVRYDSAGLSYTFWYNQNTSQSYINFPDGTPGGTPVALTGVAGPIADVAMLPNGDFSLIWEQGTQLKYQHFVSATPQGTPLVLDTSLWRGGSARLAMTAVGTWAATWEHGNYAEGDIYLRRFKDGTSIFNGAINASATATYGSAGAPALALDPSGKLLVAWTDDDNTFDAVSARVRGRFFGPTGASSGSEFTVSGAGQKINILVDHANAVAVLPQGDFVVAYTVASTVGTGDDIYARRYRSTGTARDASPWAVNRYLAGNQNHPVIAVSPRSADAQGDTPDPFLIVWNSIGQEVGQPSSGGVFGQAFTIGAQPLGGMFGVNTTLTGSQSLRSVAMLNRYSQFRVGWEGNGPGDSAGVFTQTFRINHAPTDVQLVDNYYIPSLREHQPTGGYVAQIYLDDPDGVSAGDQYTYTLVNEPGLDSSAFLVNGSQLNANVSFDYLTKPSYRIRLRVTDGGGKSVERDFVLNVTRTITGAIGTTRSAKYIDDDGDVYTVKLTGPGTMQVTQLDTDGDGRGAIDAISVTGTDGVRSSLTVTVAKAAKGDGVVRINQLSVSDAIKSIDVRASDILGIPYGGLYATQVGSILLRDLAPGAELNVDDGDFTHSTRVTARVIHANSSIGSMNRLTLTAARIEAATINGAAIDRLTVTGNSSAKIAGDMFGSLTLNGLSNPSLPTLGTATIAGQLAQSHWSVVGMVSTIKVTGDISNWTLAVTSRRPIDVPGGLLAPGDGALTTLSSGRQIIASRINVARAIGTLSTPRWIGSRVEADSLKTLTVRGDFSGVVKLRGTEVASTANTLNAASVSGVTSYATFLIDGNVGSFSTKQFLNSTFWVGFTSLTAGINPIVDPGTFLLSEAKIGLFRTTSSVDSFRDSSVVADRITTLSLASLPIAAEPDLFGVAFGTTYTKFILAGKTVSVNGTALQKGSFRLKLL